MLGNEWVVCEPNWSEFIQDRVGRPRNQRQTAEDSHNICSSNALPRKAPNREMRPICVGCLFVLSIKLEWQAQVAPLLVPAIPPPTAFDFAGCSENTLRILGPQEVFAVAPPPAPSGRFRGFLPFGGGDSPGGVICGQFDPSICWIDWLNPFREITMSAFPKALVLGALAITLCGSPVFGQFGNTKEPAVAAVPIKAPRELRVHLDRAKKALESKDYHLLCEHVNELLKTDGADYFVDDQNDTTGLKEEVARLVLGLSGQAKEAYELRFGAKAEAKLDEILQQSDWAELSTFHQRFVGTKAGAKAALMSARMLMEQGKPAAAAMRLRRIVGISNDLEPELSVLQATCWLQAGDRVSARQSLLALHRTNKPSSIMLGGTEAPWFENETGVDAWIDKQLAPIAPVLKEVVKTDRPDFVLSWNVASGETIQESDLLKSLRDQFNRRGVTAMPTSSPLDAGKWVVARSTRRLFGFDPIGGKRVWLFPPRPEENLKSQLTTTMHEHRETLTASGEAVFRRTWTDAIYAALATDGETLLLIDRLNPPIPKSKYGRRPVMQLPGVPVRDPDMNRLVALDLGREGALSWTVGGTDGVSDELKKAFFLSPPLIHGEQIYVLAEVDDLIKLVVLAKGSGAVEWTQSLLTMNDKVSNNPERRLRGGRLALQNGVLLCWTGADYLIGMDLTEKRFIWKRRILNGGSDDAEQRDIETYAAGRQNVYYRGPGGVDWAKFVKEANPGSRWANASLLCSHRFCVATPPTINSLKCIDLYSGEVVWSKPRQDFLYAACNFEDHVLLVGRYRLALVDLATGVPKWVTAQQTLGIPSGRGVLVGHYFYLPTSEGELLSVDMDNGQTQSRNTGATLGNLAYLGDMIVSQSPTNFVAFAQQAPAKATDDGQPVASTKDEQDVTKIVQRLGDESFRNREEAERRLTELGISATAALRVGLEDVDPELRIRCRRLLDQISKDSRLTLLAEFKKGGPDAKGLPGWKGFQSLVGEDKKSREFFAQMYSAEFSLFEAAKSEPVKLGETLLQRCTELQNATQQFGYQLSLPTVATVLYLTTHESARKNSSVSAMASNFCNQNAFRQAIANGENSDLMKKLLVGLMQNMTGTPNYQLIMLCLQYDIKECYQPARAFAKNKQQSGYAKGNAIFAVARYGNKEDDTSILEDLLADKQQCTTYSINGKRYVTKVCDAALVGLLELYKLDPKKHGFGRFQKNGNQIAIHTIGFETDKERDAVFEKWPEAKKKQIEKVAKGDDDKAEDKKDGDKKDGDDKKADDKKADDKKADDKKAEDKKAEDKKAEDKKAEDKKAEDKKADDKKADDTKADDTKADDKKEPAEKKPTEKKPAEKVVEEKKKPSESPKK